MSSWGLREATSSAGSMGKTSSTARAEMTCFSAEEVTIVWMAAAAATSPLAALATIAARPKSSKVADLRAIRTGLRLPPKQPSDDGAESLRGERRPAQRLARRDGRGAVKMVA